MKPILKHTLPMSFLLLSLFAGWAAQAQEAGVDSTKERSAWLSIKSSTPGSDIYLDGKLIGKTPVPFFAVDSGKHEIVLNRSAENSWMMTNWTKSIELTWGDSLDVFAQLKRPFLIKSQPFGAEVYHDGMLQGTTPLIFELPDTSTAQVTLILEGYRPGSVVCRPEGSQYLETVLAEDPMFVSQQQQILEQAGIRKAKSGRRALIFTGLSLATGLAAMALKKEADDAYDRYLQSGDPAERDGFFDRAEKYDRYTSVAMGAFQVNLVLSLYSFYNSQR